MRGSAEESEIKCNGGLGFGSRVQEHTKKQEVRCYLCDAVLGCEICCSNREEILCLNCHRWGSREVFEFHGPLKSREYARQFMHDLLSNMKKFPPESKESEAPSIPPDALAPASSWPPAGLSDGP